MSITEDELKERATAPRVNLEEVLGSISKESYHLLEGTLTICVLTLQNGFTVTGQSACADPANYQADIGQSIAKQDAINKIWPLLGYELKTKLALIDAGTAKSDPHMWTYVGTKVVHALPMDRQNYNLLRSFSQASGNVDPFAEGYLVEYADGGVGNVAGFTGYVSWSPKNVFEAAYKEVGRTPAPKVEICECGSPTCEWNGPKDEPANPVTTWLDLAKIELVELEDRVIKLVALLASPSITTIDPREWTALREQRKGMEAYLCQLRGRVARASL